MDKKTVAWAKSKFPKIFSLVVKSTWLMRFITNLDVIRYYYRIRTGRPYFGTFCLAGQTWEERKPWMKALIAKESQYKKNGEINLLEVGSWAGNSAILWADAIRASGANPKIVCVDAWESYIQNSSQDKINVATLLMDQDLKRNRILRLFLHNIKASGHQHYIYPFKGASDALLPTMKHDSFDIVYLDGDHRYGQLMRDLNHAARVLRVGGVLCGDDFDKTFDEVDQQYTTVNREINVSIDPKTGSVYHPGVTMALKDFFGNSVSSYAGFWLSRKTANGWQKINLHE